MALFVWEIKSRYFLPLARRTRPEFFLRPRLIRVVLLSYESKPTDIREQHDWMALKILEGLVLDQFFFCDPVVLESICYCTRAKQLINESNTTRWLEKKFGQDILFEVKKASVGDISCATSFNRSYRGVRLGIQLVQIFPDIRSYCSSLSVTLLSYASRSTLIRLKCRKQIWTGRVGLSLFFYPFMVSQLVKAILCNKCNN